MKKLAILSAMMFAVALWFGGTVSASPTTDGVAPSGTTVVEDCGDTLCDDVAAGEGTITDIESVSATSGAGDIVVTVVTCGAFDDIIAEPRMIKYRLHIDHKSPGGARYPDGHVFTADDEDGLDDCETSSDDGVMFRVHKNGNTRVYGPGSVVEDNTDPWTLTFTVPYAGLLDDETVPGAVAAGDVVHLWMDVQQKQICDRAPDTDDSDLCAKPEEADPVEVLSILLQ